MVLTDSHEIPRAPRYLGNTQTPRKLFQIRDYHPLRSAFPNDSPTATCNARSMAALQKRIPTTPILQPLPGITQNRFSLIQFRSPLLPESLLFSLPVGTEMFHFPTFPPNALYIQAPVTRTQNRLARFPHSEILESQPVYQLPEAYRRLPRPSSALDAKASTVRS